MIEFIPNGVDINVPDDYAIWIFFSKKTQMFRIKFFLIQNFSKSFIIIIDLFNVDINITIKITLAFMKIRLIDVN